MTRQHFDHSNCAHEKTKAGRAACRKTMRAEALGETAAKAPTAGTAKAPAKKAPAKPAAAPAAKKSPTRATPAKKATAAPAKPAETK
ncbi:hypothetical protein OG342_14925 [Streptomyces bobili]|uniref:hypothetical protein n=1 Tax=Streptomyces bobili TaxID=67280 RepID=UPI002254FFFA|nr:hypothetical protein [Streptomyces bobili]MCX5524148.1 hypothetical protein [Streptomyces bobili]